MICNEHLSIKKIQNHILWILGGLAVFVLGGYLYCQNMSADITAVKIEQASVRADLVHIKDTLEKIDNKLDRLGK